MSTKGTFWYWWIFHYYHDCIDNTMYLDIADRILIRLWRAK